MKKLIYIAGLWLICSNAMGQGLDPEFSMYKQQPLLMNPALAGNGESKFRLNAQVREQYWVISQPYRSGAFNFDINLPINAWAGNIWGAGFNVAYDDQGDTRLRNVRYNLNFSIGQYLDPRQQHSISVGFQGGLGNRSIDYGNIYWDNQWVGEGFALFRDPNENLPTDVAGYTDVSTGVQYSYMGDIVQLTGGYAMFHANRPDISLYIDTNEHLLARRHTVHFDMTHRIRKDNMFAMNPSFLWTRQGKTNNLIFGNDFIFYFNEPTAVTGYRKEYSMALGLYHRWAKDIVATMTFNLAGISFGASYDITMNNLNQLNGYQGAWEVFLGYRGGFRKGSNSRYMPHRKGKL